jgi:hypothetical protein
MSSNNNWDAVAAHIERHAGGCWTWDGSPVAGNIFRMVAEAYGAPLPVRRGKLYRMPDCTVGRNCVNPNHLGTARDFVLAVHGRRQEIPEPTKTGTGIWLTMKDRRFLKSLKILWE